MTAIGLLETAKAKRLAAWKPKVVARRANRP